MSKEPLGLNGLPSHDYFLDAVNHIDEAVSTKGIALGAAKGIIYSITETLGAMIGDPNLPSHLRSGYAGALELAHELEAKIARLN
jgi:O-acetyl-ADP-ribose deacetylase (regulator of RNase III)